MTVQRKSYEIVTLANPVDENEQIVQLSILVRGQIEDKGDALLMIGEAWSDAIEAAGHDPVAAIQKIKNESKLQ